MSLPRFVARGETFDTGVVHLDGDEARHAIVVLRLRPGDRIEVINGEGSGYQARIADLAGQELVVAQLEQPLPPTREPRLKVSLYQGLAKGDKMDFIVQKATEIGVSAIQPVFTRHTVLRAEAGWAEKRSVRWQRVAQEAAKQAGRLKVPVVQVPVSWPQALAQLAAQASTLTLVAWEGERTSKLKAVLRSWLGKRPQGEATVALVVGPEGGLAWDEVEAAVAVGAIPVSLGARILRTETAALAALSILFYEWGDLGGDVVGK